MNPQPPSVFVGEVYPLNSGGFVEVIKYKNSKSITVLFEDGYAQVVNSYNLKTGQIKNPLAKIHAKVGYIGRGVHKACIGKKPTKAFQVWQGMLHRCYNTSRLEKYPTYKGCTVDERWHCFQTFAEWYYSQSKSEYEMDVEKDYIVLGNKIYSPETCFLIPSFLNNLIGGTGICKRGNYPKGVHLHKSGKFQAECSLYGKSTYLGLFENPEDAFRKYKKVKEAYVREVAEKYKEYLPDKAYFNLTNYVVNIDD